MQSSELEQSLRELPKHGTLIKDRGYRQVWRFEHGGRAYYLKFYPRRRTWWKRLVRGNPALREFLRLQWIQKARVPSPRAVAVLVGFRINSELGDAVILEAIEPAVRLDQYLNDRMLSGEEIPHRQLMHQLVALVGDLARAGLGHGDLHLGNILLHEGKLYLLDGYAVRKGGLRKVDLLGLAHSVRPHATRADLVRGWRELAGGPLPRSNPVARRQVRKVMTRITGENLYFGRLRVGAWHGHYFKLDKQARRWSPVSGMQFTREQWEKAWPVILDLVHNDQLTILKRSLSGDVLAGEIVVGGRPLNVVIKRPRRRRWYRYLNEIGRGGRAQRAWRKAWHLVSRNLPTAWPLLLMEKRALGYVTDAVIVFEQVPGPTLADVDLEAMGDESRDLLFRRTGRMLREIERFGFSHFDAKASNWIVQGDERRGPRPILIDVDGIRRRRWDGLGLERLLRSMRQHPHYRPADSLAICRGYAPFAKVVKVKPAASET